MTTGPTPYLTRRSLLATAAVSALGLAVSPAFAQTRLDEGSITATVQTLRPGQFLWAPEAAPEGPVIIVVSLSKQRAYVYRNGVLIGVSTISSGTAGHETPTGIFTILQKKVDHKSNLYDDAPMPFMQRLTWSGIAMHAGYPASHGCIRLPLAFAEHLYGVTQLGLTVIITQSADIPRFAPAPHVLENRGASPSSFESAFSTTWQPEKAPTGPVSIILSASDARAVVLRNGVEIGSAPIAIRGQVSGLQAFTLSSIDQHGTHWMYLPLLGNTRTGEVSRQERERLTLPEDFRQNLLVILKPGSTLIVTADSLQSGNTGAAVTVITSENPE
ncbi:L,D-transpeptidase [Sphingomonas sp. MM-1]|uniref:L,D-transpeptidase n=1 Tax=Sphingomonas sp. MM-1 TaxID=745310 RepID=UPI0009FEAC15|nr:L,D-transpeptidase [Sphingomonas sp. MM-1]